MDFDSEASVAKGFQQNNDLEANSLSGGSGHGSATTSSSNNAQAGVKNIEAVVMTWTEWGLIAAYLSIFLMAFTVSLEQQTVLSLSVFATSSFKQHSLISTVYVVQGVVNAVIKPPMAKIANVFGRLEAFSFSIFLYVIGYIQMATSSSVQTYAAAQIFYSAGSTGLQIIQQIFIADTSDPLNRALWSSLPDIPFLITVWCGSIIGNDIINTTTWRWGYGMWCIVLPVMFLPLSSALFWNNRKAKKLGLTAPSPWRRIGVVQILKSLWFELDIGGIILLSAAFSLILIPCTIASKAANGWQSGDIIAMLVIGFVCLFLYPLWESNKKLAPGSLTPLRLFKSRTFCAGCALGFFYFVVFYLSVQPYFYSYLLVVQNESITAAGHVTQVFSFSSTVASIVISLVIKYTKICKPFICLDSIIYIVGIGLMIRYRTQGVSVSQLVGTQICLGIGGGMLNVPAQLGVQASTDHQNVAVATAVYLMSVEIGGSIGSAISGAVWGKNIPTKLTEYLPAASKQNATTIYNSIDNALAYPVGTPERAAIDRAYQETMRILLIIAIYVAVPLIPLSLLMKNYKLDSWSRVSKVESLVAEWSREEKFRS
ncbi:probable major facilitator protein MIRC (siderophore transporter) [Phialocephala subalpina]|uniref:Probable major facilitator protein MIRC (Siderophore transporter) n=1 Tax=Phialocephala subalpina TaxID=576137 RepID=A0A1L7XP86_9HELO|nr:probable major facilitator protein MIRC (siderophore transporter) [Phialocephala subalpina]